MPRRFILLIVIAAITAVIQVKADPSKKTVLEKQFYYPIFNGEVLRPEDPPGIELTERGKHVRGVYTPISKLVHWSPKKVLSWVKTVGANAVIIDIKDDKGRVTFTNKLPDAHGRPHGIIPRMKRLIKTLKNNDIYLIGRLVCFKDDIFSRNNPDAAIIDRRDAKLWRDRANMAWLDPFSLKAHKYIASIALKAEKFGFDEIQLDYVRFPVDGQSKYARFANREKGMQRYEAIALLLARVDMTISLPLSIDVFGLTAHTIGDTQGLGQSLEHLSPYLDAISPMLYVANFPKEIWESSDPKKVYNLVHNAVKSIRDRLEDTVAVRPLLQGFSYRATDFGVKFINNQIIAAKQAGSSGYLFWNQGGHYSKLSIAWKRLGNSRATAENKGEEKQPLNKKEKKDLKKDTSKKGLEIAANPFEPLISND